MKFMPRSIFGRTLLVLLLALVISQVVGLLIYSGDRRDELAKMGGRQMSGRIAAIVETLERTPSDQRHLIVMSSRGPGFNLSLTPESVVKETDKGWRARKVRETIKDYLDLTDDESVRVSYRSWNAGHRQAQQSGLQNGSDRWRRHWHGTELMTASVQLSDGNWINAASPVHRFGPYWWSRGSFSVFLITAALIAFSVWAMKRSTAPLALFERAAERLGRDVNAPPLPEDGPREVQSAARAFNEMQRRLRAFVRDRTQMLAAISHDLRTPITRLRLRAELIEDSEQQQKMLEDLKQMEDMIAATLAFARDEDSEEPAVSFDLVALLQAVVDDKADIGGTVTFSGPAKIVYSGRPTALRRVFQNLVDNAVAYGGQADVSLSRDGKDVTISFEDDGPGIPSSEREKVFQPFYRVENSRSRETGGVGLGLAVSRTVIRAHGGDIAMGTSPEGKFRMIVTLPIEDDLP